MLVKPCRALPKAASEKRQLEESVATFIVVAQCRRSRCLLPIHMRSKNTSSRRIHHRPSRKVTKGSAKRRPQESLATLFLPYMCPASRCLLPIHIRSKNASALLASDPYFLTRIHHRPSRKVPKGSTKRQPEESVATLFVVLHVPP
jgi:hypothetical protein